MKECTKKCDYRIENAIVIDEVKGEEEEGEEEKSPEQKYVDGLVDDGEEEEHVHYHSKEMDEALLE